jgi:hypothetical protein
LPKSLQIQPLMHLDFDARQLDRPALGTGDDTANSQLPLVPNSNGDLLGFLIED